MHKTLLNSINTITNIGNTQNNDFFEKQIVLKTTIIIGEGYPGR